MPSYNFNPIRIPDNSVWRGKMFHFTYPSFISISTFLAKVSRITSIQVVAWSYAHEYGTDEDGEPYEHSHFAIIFAVPIKIHGSRKFDLVVMSDDGTDATTYHPHILPKLTTGAMEAIFKHYHAGRKYDSKAGKIVFKAPVRNESKIHPDFEFCREVISEVIEAPSLIEACVVGSVRPRNVTDIKLLREDASATAANTFHHKYPRDSFCKFGPTDYGALHIHGGTNLGKTKWALAQFKNPLLIKPFDQVGSLEAIGKKFNPQLHDGIVLDEADLRFMTRQQCIALLDIDESCELNVRYKSMSLPAGVKKILVSNPPPDGLYPPDPHGAISRRVKTLLISAPTYYLAPPPAAPPRTPAEQHVHDGGNTQATCTTPVIYLLTPATQPD